MKNKIMLSKKGKEGRIYLSLIPKAIQLHLSLEFVYVWHWMPWVLLETAIPNSSLFSTQVTINIYK